MFYLIFIAFFIYIPNRWPRLYGKRTLTGKAIRLASERAMGAKGTPVLNSALSKQGFSQLPSENP